MSVNLTIRDYVLEQEGGPYIFGATAKPCTPSYRRARMEQYPDMAPKIKEFCPVLNGSRKSCSGCKHEGRLAFDCAQLNRWAADAAGLKLPSGARSQFTGRSPHSGWAAGGTIDRLPLEQVAFVYRKKSDGSVPHTGTYTGDGFVVDARGHKSGVVRSLLHSYNWTDFRVLKGQELVPGVPLLGDIPDIKPKNDEQGVVDVDAERNLKVVSGQPLMRGQDVKNVQAFLIHQGYNVGKKGADGIFGRDTEAAVIAFQSKHGLEADGVWSKAENDKMAELLNELQPPATTVPPVIPDDSINLVLPRSTAVSLAEALKGVL
jgi:hypothetical protein